MVKGRAAITMHGDSKQENQKKQEEKRFQYTLHSIQSATVVLDSISVKDAAEVKKSKNET